MEILLTLIVFMFLGMLIASIFTGLFGIIFWASLWIMGVLLSIVAYFLPLFIASARKHKNVLPIALINIFLGWCPLFWIIALIWALDWHIVIKNWFENKKCIEETSDKESCKLKD